MHSPLPIGFALASGIAAFDNAGGGGGTLYCKQIDALGNCFQ
jgi:hypothetical protein